MHVLNLQDFANYHISRDRYVPLCYQLYYSIEMLRIFDYMHRLRIIHCDVSLFGIIFFIYCYSFYQ
jgi:hypothetical protein